MKLKIHTLLIYSMLLLGMTACSDYSHFEPYELPPQDFAFLNSLEPEGTHISIDPKIKNVVQTADSVIVEIPGNSFVNDYGELPSEQIEISINQYRHSSGWLAKDLSFESDQNQLIAIRTLFYIVAYTQSGHVLRQAEGKSIQVKFPDANPSSELFLYFPNTQNFEENLFKWSETGTSQQQNRVFSESWTWESETGELIQSTGYQFNATRSKWIAVGYPVETSHGVNIETELPESFTAINTRVFIKGLDDITFHRLEWDSFRHKFCDLESKVVAGKEYRLIIISYIDGNIYLKIADIPIFDDVEIKTEPEFTSWEEALDRIKNI